MAKLPAGGPLLPEDLVIWEILTRLPVRSLLRCRAVCRSWRRRITSDAEFLLAHHRRQPSLPLLTTWNECRDRMHERRIDAFDHRTGERRPVIRTSARNALEVDNLNVLASCDGLLILLAHGGHVICNPATRQRAPLPLLHGAACVCALYHHRPSGSYRVLCCFEGAEGGHAVYHVHAVGSRELRCVGEPPAPWSSNDMLRDMPNMLLFHPHVVAGGRIYWQPVKLPGGNGKVNNMLVFDTMAESFQQLQSPVEGPFLELFQMNSGALGLYHYRGGTVDLWVLQEQDHGSWSWSMNHWIKLPEGLKFAGLVRSALLPVLDPEGDVLVVSERGIRYSVRWQHLQHISGANGSVLARYEWDAYLNLCRHRLKESLVHHDFFSMEGVADGVVEKPLFDGLSTVAVLRDDSSDEQHCQKEAVSVHASKAVASPQDGVPPDGSKLSSKNSTVD